MRWRLKSLKYASLWFAMLFLCIFSAQAADNVSSSPLTIHLYELQDRLDSEGSKGYNYLIEDLLSGYKRQVKFRLAPIRRNSKEFIRNEGSCVFPANINAIKKANEEAANARYISSEPIDTVSVYIYVAENMIPPKSFDELKNRHIGHVTGSVARFFLKDSGAEVHSAASDDLLLQMLMNGRIDTIVGFHPDIAIAFDRLGYRNLVRSKDFVLLKANTSFVCHETEDNRDFIDWVNPRIIDMAKSGLIQKHLGRHAEVPHASTLNADINKSPMHN